MNKNIYCCKGIKERKLNIIGLNLAEVKQGISLNYNLTWVDDTRKMTKRLAEYIKTESLKKTFASLSQIIGIDPKTIKNVFEEHVATLQNNFHFETPEILGIDEIHLMKKPRGIFTNIGEQTILDILKDRNKTTVISYLKTLDTKKIQLVTMDMWRRAAITEKSVFYGADIFALENLLEHGQ